MPWHSQSMTTPTSTDLDPQFYIKDPDDGRMVRDATDAERDEYLAQPVRHPAFRRPWPTAAGLVDVDYGRMPAAHAAVHARF